MDFNIDRNTEINVFIYIYTHMDIHVYMRVCVCVTSSDHSEGLPGTSDTAIAMKTLSTQILASKYPFH